MAINKNHSKDKLIPTGNILVVSAKGSLVIPRGTTAERPSVPVEGMLRYNTTLGIYETYSSGSWNIVKAGDYVKNLNMSGSAGISVSGNVVGENYNYEIRLSNTGVSAGTYNNVVVDAQGRVIDGSSVNYLTSVNVSTLGTGNVLIYSSGTSEIISKSLFGNDGVKISSSPAGLTISLSSDVVTPGTFTKVTVDTHGRIISGTSASLSELNVPTSNVDFNDFRIVNLGDPVGNKDAANKEYVDTVAAGLTWKNSVYLATTTDIELSGLFTIDGLTPVSGDRILVKNQTDPKLNGIYVAKSTTWTRASDFDGTPSNEVKGGAAVFVAAGSSNSDTGWVLIQPNGIANVGVDNLIWTQFVGNITLFGGEGINVSGNIIELAGQALEFHKLSATGLVTRTGPSSIVTRSIQAGTGISITNSDGVAGNPTISTDIKASSVGGATNIIVGVSGGSEILLRSIETSSPINVSTSTNTIKIEIDDIYPVDKTIKLRTNTWQKGIMFFSVQSGASNLNEFYIQRGASDISKDWLVNHISSSANAGWGVFTPGLVSRLFVKGDTGNIGVGTTTPSERFEIVGTAKATHIKVSAEGQSYQLPTSAGTTGQILITGGDNAKARWSSTIDQLVISGLSVTRIHNTPVISRYNAIDEGGEIQLARASDNAPHIALDVFGTGIHPKFRIVSITSGETWGELDISSSADTNISLLTRGRADRRYLLNTVSDWFTGNILYFGPTETTSNHMRIENTVTSAMVFGFGTGKNNFRMYFDTTSKFAMRLNENGRLGINLTYDPTYQLHVEGSAYVSDVLTVSNMRSTSGIFLNPNVSGGWVYSTSPTSGRSYCAPYFSGDYQYNWEMGFDSGTNTKGWYFKQGILIRDSSVSKLHIGPVDPDSTGIVPITGSDTKLFTRGIIYSSSTQTWTIGGRIKISAGESDYFLPTSAGTTGQILTTDGSNTYWQTITLFNGITLSSFGGGATLALGVSANREIQLRTLTGAGIAEVTTVGNTVQVSAAKATLETSSLGGVSLGLAVSAGTGNRNELRIRGLTGGGIIEVSSLTNSIIISAAQNITNSAFGGGINPIIAISGNSEIQTRTFVGGGIVEVSSKANGEIIVSAKSAIKRLITQPGHGFEHGDVIYLDDDDNTWKLALSTSADTLGVALVNYIDANNFEAIFAGEISDLSGLVPGNFYFTSNISAGKLQITEPSAFSNPVIYSVLTSVAIVLPYRPSETTDKYNLSISGLGTGISVLRNVEVDDQIVYRTLVNSSTVQISASPTSIEFNVVSNNLSVPERIYFRAKDFDNPNNSDWYVPTSAPSLTDTLNNSLTVRVFDDLTPYKGVGGIIRIPNSSYSTFHLGFVLRSPIAPPTAQSVVFGFGFKRIPNNSPISVWVVSSLPAFTIPTNTNYQYFTSPEYSITGFGFVHNQVTQFEIWRIVDAALDTLGNEVYLLEFYIEFRP